MDESTNTMPTYVVPEEAMDLAWRAFAAHEDDYVSALADAITAAAPLIVAAELRRQADIQEQYANGFSTQAFLRVAFTAVHRLRECANALDQSSTVE